MTPAFFSKIQYHCIQDQFLPRSELEEESLAIYFRILGTNVVLMEHY